MRKKRTLNKAFVCGLLLTGQFCYAGVSVSGENNTSAADENNMVITYETCLKFKGKTKSQVESLIGYELNEGNAFVFQPEYESYMFHLSDKSRGSAMADCVIGINGKNKHVMRVQEIL